MLFALGQAARPRIPLAGFLRVKPGPDRLRNGRFAVSGRMSRMTRTRIKICGVRDVATAQAAVAAGADAVGLVLVAGSPRCINVDQAKEIAAALPAR